MMKPSKNKTGKREKAKSIQTKPTPKEKMSVDALCDLWERVLNYRRALQDRVKIAEGKLPLSTGNPVGPGMASKAAILEMILDNPRWPERPKYKYSAKRDLEAFDRQLSNHSGKADPPTWLDSDWVQDSCGGILSVIDSLQVMDSERHRVPGTLIYKVVDAFYWVYNLVVAIDNGDRSEGALFISYQARATIASAATYCNQSHKGKPESLFVIEPINLSDEEFLERHSQANAESRLEKQEKRLMELINSSKEGVKTAGKRPTVRNRAAWVLAQISGVSISTVLNRWLPKRKKIEINKLA